MKSLGQGSGEAIEVAVTVLVSRLLCRACRERQLGCQPDGTGRKPA